MKKHSYTPSFENTQAWLERRAKFLWIPTLASSRPGVMISNPLRIFSSIFSVVHFPGSVLKVLQGGRSIAILCKWSTKLPLLNYVLGFRSNSKRFWLTRETSHSMNSQIITSSGHSFATFFSPVAIVMICYSIGTTRLALHCRIETDFLSLHYRCNKSLYMGWRRCLVGQLRIYLFLYIIINN